MITNERNKELTLARFYPLTANRYQFEYRGVEVTISLFSNPPDGEYWWVCNNLGVAAIDFDADTPALEMAAQLRQWILDTIPADRLREEGYNSLDWIGESVRAARRDEGI